MAKAGIYCGHGKSTDGNFDPGTTYKGKTEAKMMLPITQAAVKHLRASGVTVYTDVDSGENNNINMIKQVQEANNKDVDVFVSIHCDWYKAPTGTLPLYYPGSSKGKKLAEYINKHVMKDAGIGTRGLDDRGDLYELKATNMPACIFECGSIKYDADEWDTAAECETYGKAIAKGICEYLGVTFKSAGSNSSSGSTSKSTTKLVVDGIKGAKTIKAWQKYLNKVGYSCGTADGIMGVKTIKATQKFLNANDYNCGKVDGIMGAKTIKALQKFFNAKGYSCGKVDGIMGVKTVKAWQKYINSKA